MNAKRQAEQYPTYPFRVVMEDGTIHLIQRIGISQVAAEFPNAARWERRDKRQPAILTIDNEG